MCHHQIDERADIEELLEDAEADEHVDREAAEAPADD
ncbi:hypothetical protein SAMN06269185_2620 [Natronoarchaeum philippinense]|uniref:Uncharacterized protein n=1 Tax=Natronoarchaeum philippinense TaxID=558529 RepID=A0A285P287_NATPI|nr:hypothetical protein SAMN06269185_2620 [Natronoarchaeum philippinense]